MSDVVDKKQKLLLEYMLSEPDAFAKCYKITDPTFFDSPLDRVVEFVLGYFEKYGGIAPKDAIEAETGMLLKQQQIENLSDMTYFLEEYESFCRDEKMSQAILRSVDLIQEGRSNEVEALVREAMLVKLDKSVGLDLFLNVKDRIIYMDENLINYSTGSKLVDELIGRVRRGELIVTSAVSSGGKSLHLGNMGIALAKQGLDVAIVSLELNEPLYAKRLDSMITGLDIADHKKNADYIDLLMAESKESMGNFIIKQMSPGSNASQIRAYLLEYSLEYGKYPDVLIVDYIGIMGATTKSNNKFDQDEEKAIALRQMAVEYDMITLTAQQLNRDAANVVDVNYSHLSGGISLANTADALFALVQTEQDIDNNQVQVRWIKLRNAPKTNKPVILYRCPRTLRFSDSPNAKTTNLAKPSYIKKTADKEESPKPTNGKDKLKKALSKR